MIEITVALAIISFALVAIMGLFPVAMKNATESQRETRATFIAQSIFADLAAGASPTNTFAATSTNLASSPLAINLSTNQATFSLFYSDEGQPQGVNVAPTSVYEGIIKITRDTVLTNLSRVEVQIEAPASAPTNNRTRYHFLTWMRNQ